MQEVFQLLPIEAVQVLGHRIEQRPHLAIADLRHHPCFAQLALEALGFLADPLAVPLHFFDLAQDGPRLGHFRRHGHELLDLAVHAADLGPQRLDLAAFAGEVARAAFAQQTVDERVRTEIAGDLVEHCLVDVDGVHLATFAGAIPAAGAIAVPGSAVGRRQEAGQ